MRGVKGAICALGVAGALGCGSAKLTPPGAARAGGMVADAGGVSVADAGMVADAGKTSQPASFPSGTCDPPPGGVRALAPLSGSVVTSSRPLLRFVAGSGDRTDVQICTDRGCSQPVWQATTPGTNAAPGSDLAPGYYFWRVRDAGQQGPWTSPWLFRVRPRQPGYAPVANTAAELFSDYNGDGYPDAAIDGAAGITIYLGGPDGLSPQRVLHPGPHEWATDAPAADLNGDGFTDFAAVFTGGATAAALAIVQFGGPDGLGPPANQIELAPSSAYLSIDAPVGVGDVDGDGYGDFGVTGRYGGLLVHGCASGPPPGYWMGLACGDCQERVLATGDLNGDGLWDVAFSDAGGTMLYLGGTAPAAVSLNGTSAQDVLDWNGDGYSDLLALTNASEYAYLPGGPGGVDAQSTKALPTEWVSQLTADFNGDGYWDVVDLHAGTVWYGDAVSPTQTFSKGTALPDATLIQVPSQVLPVDLNGDGYDDLVMLLKDGRVVFLAGSAAGLSSDPVVAPAPGSAATDAGSPDAGAAPADAGSSAGSPLVGFRGDCPAPPPGPRQLAPISGSVVASAQPTLTFVPADGAGTTDVEICADWNCTRPVWRATIAGNQATPDVPLPPGYWFWIIRPSGLNVGSNRWLFRVRRRSAATAPVANTAAELFGDYNGDGYPDAVVYGDQITIYLGGPNGPSAERVLHPPGNPKLDGVMGGPGGDLNGDGYSDFATPHDILTSSGALLPFAVVQFGGPGGLGDLANQVALDTQQYPLSVHVPVGVGDVDGDGYGDLAVAMRYGGWLIHGCASGPPPGPWVQLLAPTFARTPASRAGTSTVMGSPMWCLAEPAWASTWADPPRPPPGSILVCLASWT